MEWLLPLAANEGLLLYLLRELLQGREVKCKNFRGMESRSRALTEGIVTDGKAFSDMPGLRDISPKQRCSRAITRYSAFTFSETFGFTVILPTKANGDESL